MTYQQALDYLDQLKPAGMQMGLERTRCACEALGHPEQSFPVIHIAGTNGKGSTARMLADILHANGYKAGLYTSPPLFGPCDTMWIGHERIPEEAFAACISRVAAAMPTGLSEYECLTCAMFVYFQEQHVDIAVIECCLGGETDTTNVIPTPLCAVFTPIAKDHTAVLGDTIEAIARQKSGIIKPSCDVVCAPDMNEEALRVIFEKASETGSTVYFPRSPESGVTDQNGTRFFFNDRVFTLSLTGAHQQVNAVTALTVTERLQHHGFRFDEEQTKNALQGVTMPCRQECISRDPLVILDGAHNPHGIAALCDTVKTLAEEPITLVIGMLADKNTERCLELLAPLCREIICCTPQGTPRALPSRELAVIASRYHSNVSSVEDPFEALQTAKKTAAHAPIVVGGSFYTAAAVRRRLS